MRVYWMEYQPWINEAPTGGPDLDPMYKYEGEVIGTYSNFLGKPHFTVQRGGRFYHVAQERCRIVKENIYRGGTR